MENAGHGRIPPHNLQAEESLLGAMLLSRDAVTDATNICSSSDFYKPAHAYVFDAICALDQRGDPIDVTTVAYQLERQHLLQEAGGPAYLLNLQASTPATSNAEKYARIVFDTCRLRRLIGAAGEIAELGYNDTDNVDVTIDRAEQIVHQITDNRTATASPAWGEDMQALLDRIDARVDGHGVNGTPTGFHDLDTLTTGLHDGQLVTLAARPGMGKTALALQIALNAAAAGHPVLFVSLEMSRDELVDRAVSADGQIPLAHIRRGTLTENDWRRFHETVGRLSGLPLQIEDDPSITLPRVRSVARRAERRLGPLGLIIVDYIQLLTPTHKGENRQVEVSELSRGMKLLARSLHVPVLQLSQLNRGLEQRADKRPMLADLRESGAIENDSDVVCFAYRDEMYHPDTRDRGVAELIVAKHRNGPTDTVRVAFTNQYARFSNMSRA